MKSLIGKIGDYLLYAGLNKNEYLNVCEDIDEDNKSVIRFSAVLLTVLMGSALIYTVFTGALDHNRDLFRIGVLVGGAFLLTYLLIGRKNHYVIRGMVILMEILVMVMGLYNALCLTPDHSSKMLVTCMLVIAMAYSDPPYVFVPTITATTVFYCIYAGHDPVLSLSPGYSFDMMMHGILALICGINLRRIRYQRYVYLRSQKKLVEEQTNYANTDSLTGLKNYRAFMDLERVMTETMPAELCMVVMDINGLKKMNDTYGHEAGNELIVKTSEALREVFAGWEHLFRLSGDEFLAVDGADHDPKEISAKWSEISGNYSCENGVKLSLSIGAAVCNGEEDDTFNEILKRADRLMYEDKDRYYGENKTDRRGK